MKAFLFHTNNTGRAFYRIWQPAKYLDKYGIEVSRVEDNEDWVRQGTVWFNEVVEENDLLVYQLRSTGASVGMAVMSRYLTNNSSEFKYLKPIVTELDDSFLDIDKSSGDYQAMQDGKVLGQQMRKLRVDEVLEAKQEEIRIRDKIQSELRDGKVVSELPLSVVEKDGQYYALIGTADQTKVMIEQLKHSDCVIVSTKEMKERYEPYAERIEVIPNGIDFETFPAAKRNVGDTVRIGLFGGNSHYGDWKSINTVLRQILSDHKDVVLVLNTIGIGSKHTLPDYFEDLAKHPQVEIHAPVSIQEYHEWLADKRIDIGIAPLENTKFNECKSNLKYLEFGALGIPGVFSDTASYRSVKHSETGFKASNAKDWLKYLKRLISDDMLRERMGMEALKHVKKEFNMDVIGEAYAEILIDVEDDFKKHKFLKTTDIFSKTKAGGKK